jgi:hypothetical protein
MLEQNDLVYYDSFGYMRKLVASPFNPPALSVDPRLFVKHLAQHWAEDKFTTNEMPEFKRLSTKGVYIKQKLNQIYQNYPHSAYISRDRDNLFVRLSKNATIIRKYNENKKYIL